MATVYEICNAQATAEAETWHNCADLDITNIVRTRNGDGMDTLTFAVENGTALTDDLTFAYKAYIRLRRTVDNGAPELLFFGRVTTVPRTGPAGELEAQTYTVSGPGEQLGATLYRQDWVESAGVITKPRVILFQASDGTRCTTGAQIYDALSWAYACGVQIAAPSALNILTGVALPYDERVNIMCLDAIIECLRWHPHAVIWWDYTARAPVFHCQLRGTLTAVSAAMPPSGIRISERRDLQIPAVCICYEKSHTVDDANWKQTTFDIAPVIEGETEEQTAARLNATDVVWATFDLEGSTQTNASQKVVVEEFPENYLDKAWWKARETWLQDYADADITLANGRRANDTALPSILVEGTMQPWMNKEVANERICVDATITKKEGGQTVLVETRPISRTVVATNALTKTYKTVQAYDSGETIPVNVAASLYAEWAGLHCEGSLALEHNECPGTYAPGLALNITGGRIEWVTMHAMISSVVEQFDDGATLISFGPVKTIDSNSLVALFRATRNRRFAYTRTFRNGAQDSAEPGEGSAALSANNTYSGLATTMRHCLIDPAASVKHMIDLWAQSVSGGFEFATAGDGNTARTIRPREVLVPYKNASGNAVAKLSQCLCSVGYGDEVSLGGGRPATPSAVVTRGSSTETDMGSSAAYDPATPDSGKDGVTLYLSLGSYYDHTSGSPVLKEFRVALTWPNAIAPQISAASTITIDTPEQA
jgi:hypothetical protein